MGRDKQLPRARQGQDIVVEELPTEVLVYDVGRQRAHCLNAEAAAVWRLCDGRTTVEEMARRLGREVGVVELALVELSRSRLLEAPYEAKSYLRESRRRALKKMALFAGAAVAIPIVQSIVAPSVAQATSCLPSGSACTISSQCCSGVCANFCGSGGGNHCC